MSRWIVQYFKILEYDNSYCFAFILESCFCTPDRPMDLTFQMKAGEIREACELKNFPKSGKIPKSGGGGGVSVGNQEVHNSK